MEKKLRGYVRSMEEFYDSFNYCKVYVVKSVPFCDDISNPYQKVFACRRYFNKKTKQYIDQTREYPLNVKKVFQIAVGDIIYFDSDGYPGVISMRAKDDPRLKNVEVIDHSKK